MGVAAVQPFDELGDRADLVPAYLEVTDKGESIVNGRHGQSMRSCITVQH